MAKSVKCNECGEQVLKEEGVLNKNKYYHLDCLESKLNRMSSWDNLFNLINELYDTQKPTALMFKQLKDYKAAPYNFTDDGIYMTLTYYYKILDNKVKEDTGLGIIPYYYDRAKVYYNSIYDLEDYIAVFESDELSKIVITKDSRFKIRKKSIDIEIDWGEDSE